MKRLPGFEFAPALVLLLVVAGCNALRTHPDLTPREDVLSTIIQITTKAKYVTAAFSDAVVDIHAAGGISRDTLAQYDVFLTRVEDLLIEVTDAYNSDDVASARVKLIESLQELRKAGDAAKFLQIPIAAIILLNIEELSSRAAELEAIP